MNVYPFIEAEKRRSTTSGQRGTVARACELLKVSRSAYYTHAATRAIGGSARDRQDAELSARIGDLHAASMGRNGSPRIHADLLELGHRHGRKRVARLMRTAGLVGKHRRRGPRTTIPDPNAGVRPDLIGRDFTPGRHGLNTRWCGDITYIRTWSGWVYLATVIDLGSRKGRGLGGR